MNKTMFGIVSVTALGLATWVFVRPAFPFPKPQQQLGPPQTNQRQEPKVGWSVENFVATMFPGASSTATVSFHSDQDLATANISVSPSLEGIVSVNPTALASVKAGHNYIITVTLTAPPDLVKRSFGGTIHVKDGEQTPKTYSQPLAVNLQTDWNTLVDAKLGFTLFYPRDFYLVASDTNANVYYLDSAPGGVAIGGTAAPGASSTGYRIVISASTYQPTSTFDIYQYLAMVYPGSAIGTVVPIGVGGQPGYLVTFTQEEAGGHPLVVVYHNRYVYEIRFASTIYVSGFSDLAGLSAFQAVVKTLTFEH